MDNMIISMLEQIYGGTSVIGVDGINQTIQSFNAAAYDFAGKLNSTAVKPIAATVLAIILVLELARISAKVDGDQKLGAQQAAAAMLKAGLILIAIQNTDLILKAINEISDTIISNVTNVANAAKQAGGVNANLQDAREELEAMWATEKIGLLAVMLIPFLISIVGSLIIKVVVFIRFAELYVLSAAATLPIVFMAHPDTKSISIGYLKKYASAAMQGAVLIIIVVIFSYFQGSVLTPTRSFSLSDFVSSFGALCLPPVVFIVMIASSGRLARALVGE